MKNVAVAEIKELIYSMIGRNALACGWMVWCCLLGNSSLIAQTQPGRVRFHHLNVEPEAPRLHFEHLTKQEGLPNEGVFNLYADREGFLWLCIQGEGLFRYDGYTFKAYPTNPLDPKAFPSTVFNFDKPIYDQTGQLWFATDAGMVRYDAQNDRFHTFRHRENGLDLPVIQCLPDSDGRFWLLMGQTPSIKLYRFDPGQGLFQPYVTAGKNIYAGYGPENFFPLADALLTHMVPGHNGRLWFWGLFGQQRGLIVFNPATDQWTFYPYPMSAEELAKRNSNLMVAGLTVDEDGEWIWLYGWNTGLQAFNRRTLEWSVYTPGFTSLAVGSKDKDELWLTGYEEGLFVFNKKAARLYRYSNLNNTRDPETPLPGRLERISQQASSGILFLGGEKGISIIDPQLQYFTGKSPFPAGKVFTFYSDTSTGKVLALYENNQLHEWTERNNQLRSRDYAAQAGPDLQHFIQQDALGRYWVGASFRIDPATLELTHVNRPFENHPWTTDHLRIWRTLLMPDGDLWFCNRWGGIIHYEARQDAFNLFNPFGKNATTLPETRNALPAGNAQLWIATNQGLALFDTLNNTARVFTEIPGDTTSLPNHFVADIAFDRKGRLWIATGKGLCRYNPSTGGFQRIKNADYYFSRMVVDKQGDLWAKAREGLFHYQIAGDKGRLYTARDGLATDLYERIALSPAGAILLGSTHYFFPEEVVENQDPPRLIFTAFQVFDHDVPLPRSIDFTEEIALPYTDNFFTIGFVALNLSQPGLNRYRWQLEGIDPGWVEGGARHSASYTYLPPGTYTFRVTASNSDGYWNPAPRILRIRILPAWWQTGWFRALGLLVTGLLVFSFYRSHIAHIRDQAEVRRQEAEQAREKAEFQRRIAELEMATLRAQMNPHFLFNVLMSINRFLLENDSKRAAVYLTKFSRLIRLVLENSKAEKVSLEHELEALRLYLELEALRFKEKVRYQFDIGEEVDLQYIQVPPLIFQPFVENAIWHGLLHQDAGGTVRISVRQPDDNLLHVEIEDDGIGRARAVELKSKSAARHKSFGLQLTKDRLQLINRLQQMDNRVQVLDLTDLAGDPCGTKVILEIPV